MLMSLLKVSVLQFIRLFTFLHYIQLKFHLPWKNLGALRLGLMPHCAEERSRIHLKSTGKMALIA